MNSIWSLTHKKVFPQNTKSFYYQFLFIIRKNLLMCVSKYYSFMFVTTVDFLDRCETLYPNCLKNICNLIKKKNCQKN